MVMISSAPLGHQFFDRVAAVAAALPILLVVPGVLANGESDSLPAKLQNVLFLGGLEIARLVEDVVVRQQHLGLVENDFAVFDNGGGVLRSDGCVGRRAADITDDQGGFQTGRLQRQSIRALAPFDRGMTVFRPDRAAG